jgi:hypothetical protein
MQEGNDYELYHATQGLRRKGYILQPLRQRTNGLKVLKRIDCWTKREQKHCEHMLLQQQQQQQQQQHHRSKVTLHLTEFWASRAKGT